MALGQHRLIHGLVESASVDGFGLDRLCRRGMAAGIAETEIRSRKQAALLDRREGHEVATRRIDVAEREALALQIRQRVDGRIGGGDEKGMELSVAFTLNQRDDLVAFARLDVGEAAEIDEIERALSHTLDR